MTDAKHAPIVPDNVVAVLLADGWHRVVAGTFTVGAFGFGIDDDRQPLGFRFEEDEGASPYSPGTLAGPLDTLIAVRQVSPQGWRRWPKGIDGDEDVPPSRTSSRRSPDAGRRIGRTGS